MLTSAKPAVLSGMAIHVLEGSPHLHSASTAPVRTPISHLGQYVIYKLQCRCLTFIWISTGNSRTWLPAAATVLRPASAPTRAAVVCADAIGISCSPAPPSSPATSADPALCTGTTPCEAFLLCEPASKTLCWLCQTGPSRCELCIISEVSLPPACSCQTPAAQYWAQPGGCGPGRGHLGPGCDPLIALHDNPARRHTVCCCPLLGQPSRSHFHSLAEGSLLACVHAE